MMAFMTQFVDYTQISTRERGDSFLGLEAQAAFIEAFLQPDDLLIQPVYEEIQFGRKAARKVLECAIARVLNADATAVRRVLEWVGGE
jgi:hypothetical protein